MGFHRTPLEALNYTPTCTHKKNSKALTLIVNDFNIVIIKLLQHKGRTKHLSHRIIKSLEVILFRKRQYGTVDKSTNWRAVSFTT